MHFIQKVKRKIKRRYYYKDNESLLKSNKKRNNDESCSVTASICTADFDLDYNFDEESNNRNKFKNKIGFVHNKLDYMLLDKCNSDDRRDFELESGSLLLEKGSHDVNICEESMELALVPYKGNDNAHNNMIVTMNHAEENNVEMPKQIATSNNQNAIEVVSDFDKFVSFCNDTISTLCESPIQNTASSFFNITSTPSSNDNLEPQSTPSEEPSKETQIVEYKPNHSNAIADENGLVHIFHDKLPTLHEIIECENNDENVIKARWEYAVQMMTLDQCGSFSDIYGVAEI